MFLTPKAKLKLTGSASDKLTALENLLNKHVYGKKYQSNKLKDITSSKKTKKLKTSKKKPKKVTNIELAKQ